MQTIVTGLRDSLKSVFVSLLSVAPAFADKPAPMDSGNGRHKRKCDEISTPRQPHNES